jgi:hypothetical protein
MIALLCFFLTLLVSPFKSKSRLEAENAALRHQLIVLQRRVSGRVQLTNGDRLFLVMLYRCFPSILKAITIMRPQTLVRWHRAGFRRYWRWKSRSLGGRPQVDADLRALIRRMSSDNPLWGAPRIHGELLKLGFEVAQSSVAKYMVKRSWPPSQRWRTFMRNHSPDMAAMDLFVAPTLGFDVLYAFIIVRLARRDLVWINVTPVPPENYIRAWRRCSPQRMGVATTAPECSIGRVLRAVLAERPGIRLPRSVASPNDVSLSGDFDVDELKLQAETASEPAPCQV